MELNTSLFQVFGAILMVLGVLLFIAPILLEKMSPVDKIPWIILYIYRSNGFTFVTSPLLIVISILFFILSIILRAKR